MSTINIPINFYLFPFGCNQCADNGGHQLHGFTSNISNSIISEAQRDGSMPAGPEPLFELWPIGPITFMYESTRSDGTCWNAACSSDVKLISESSVIAASPCIDEFDEIDMFISSISRIPSCSFSSVFNITTESSLFDTSNRAVVGGEDDSHVLFAFLEL
ncbi:hypothetical protein GCK72_000006 [Caenorhabditis remanei]|uniref:Uncharacterized protein n=1 Tax=Caenorhabditis remanei TaxID=31234 RepID=A0A6A5HNN6_CAERE|nr:hypothetical protein GCK72_000006 [Caenorhabditis remanei]KAF1768194.1 hypothetical protein GCK72_000006 [Caenorhabditis remanei]